MRWLAVPFALLFFLRPVSAAAESAVWVAPLEKPGGAATATLQAGCDQLSFWLDAAAGDGTWALKPIGGPGRVPELLGTWHSSGGLAAVVGGVAPYTGAYVLTISGPVSATRSLTVDCPARPAPAAPLPAAPEPLPMAAAHADPPAPPPDPGPPIVAGCVLVSAALIVNGCRRASSGAGGSRARA